MRTRPTANRSMVMLLALLFMAIDLHAQYSRYAESVWSRGGSNSPIMSVVFTPDNRYLLTASSHGDVTVWDTDDGTFVRTLARLDGHITSTALSPDGAILAIALDDGHIRLIDAHNGAAIRSIAAHDGAVRSLAYSADGTRLVSGGNDNLVRLWESATGGLVRSFAGHTYVVNAVAFSSRGQIASGSDDFTLKIWDTAGTTAIRTYVWTQGAVSAVGFTPEGAHVGGIAGLGRGIIYDIAADTIVKTIQLRPAEQLRFAPDGRSLVVAGRDFTGTDKGVALWQSLIDYNDVEGWYTERVCHSADFSPDGRNIAFGSDDNEVVIVRLDSAAAGERVRHLVEHRNAVTAVALSDDESLIASGGADAQIRLHDRRNGETRWTFTTHNRSRLDDAVRSLDFSEDGTVLASAWDDGSIRLHDVATGRLLRSLYASALWGVTSTAIAPGVGQVAGGIGNGDSVVKLWDTARMEPVRTFDNGEAVNALAFTPDGEYLIAAGEGNRIKIWRVTTGELVTTISDHRSSITTLAVSDDGQMLVSGSTDSSVRIWSVPSGDPIREFVGHMQRITAVDFHRRDHVLSASADGTVRVWEIATGDEVNRYSAHPHVPVSLAVASDNGEFVTGSADGTTTLWRLNLVSAVEHVRPSLCDDLIVRGVWPNPAYAATTLDFILRSQGETTIRIVNARGDNAVALSAGRLDAGEHRIPINVESLADGIYFYEILSNGARAHGHLSIGPPD